DIEIVADDMPAGLGGGATEQAAEKSRKILFGSGTADYAFDLAGGYIEGCNQGLSAMSASQLWSYEREGWARRFFENWRSSLKWQRLKPYEKFAAMIDRHWDGIAAYCRPENKVSLGFVEGLNNKIRV